MRDTYAARQKKSKAAKAAKDKAVGDAIAVLDKLEQLARKPESEFSSDERREIDQARFNLQSVRSGWANRTRR